MTLAHDETDALGDCDAESLSLELLEVSGDAETGTLDDTDGESVLHELGDPERRPEEDAHALLLELGNADGEALLKTDALGDGKGEDDPLTVEPSSGPMLKVGRCVPSIE